jgi:hypothetical protein
VIKLVARTLENFDRSAAKRAEARSNSHKPLLHRCTLINGDRTDPNHVHHCLVMFREAQQGDGHSILVTDAGVVKSIGLHSTRSALAAASISYLWNRHA